MKQIPILSPTAATNEPAAPPPRNPALPLARISDKLHDSLIEDALDAGADPRPGRRQRVDGWTPARIRIFLRSLAECGVVEDAARAAGMSKRSAYKLRNRAAGRAFHLVWNAAELLGRRRLAGELMSRALHGCVEVIARNGEVVVERHRFDNRHSMAMLSRLDQRALADDHENIAARVVAEEFDQFVEMAAQGGDGAAEFLQRRLARQPGYREREVVGLERSENYVRYGVGMPEEIDVSDLDLAAQDSWTEEQRERAQRAGLLEDDELDAGEAMAAMVAEALGYPPAPSPMVASRLPAQEDPADKQADPIPGSAVEPLDDARPAATDSGDGQWASSSEALPASRPPAEPAVPERATSRSEHDGPESGGLPPTAGPARAEGNRELRELYPAMCRPEDDDPESGFLPPTAGPPRADGNRELRELYPAAEADEARATNRSAAQTLAEPAVPPVSGSEAVAPGDDVQAPPPEPTADPPEPAPIETREQATCLPHQYDPRSGLLPPDGWIPPKPRRY